MLGFVLHWAALLLSGLAGTAAEVSELALQTCTQDVTGE